MRVPAEYMAELGQDIRYRLRMLRASPGFTAVSLISLSLGICAGTSFFSELNATILRNLPVVEDPKELVALQSAASYPTYRRYRDRKDLFSSTLAYIAPVPFGVSVDGHTERTWGHLVTPSYFATLGVHPVLGHPCTVIGVGPKYFLGASPMKFVADLWMPLSAGGRVAPELADNALERRPAEARPTRYCWWGLR